MARRAVFLAAACASLVVTAARPARAFSIASAFSDPCHEAITIAAFVEAAPVLPIDAIALPSRSTWARAADVVLDAVGHVETEDERDNGETERRLRHQVQEGLEKVPTERLGEVVIAYEPVWAIGTGEVATPDDAQEVCSAIRERVREVHGDAAADGLRILYGGSVKAANVAGIMEQPDVDGCLVGGASLQADEFGGICRYYAMPRL